MLFVSYSRDDRDAVGRLTADLARFGREVWFDQRLEGGVEWWDEILARIRGCSTLLFVVSEGSSSSRPCREELTYALAVQRPVVPVALDPDLEDALPSELDGVQVVSYTDGSKDEIAALLRALDAENEPVPLPDPLPPAPPLPTSRFGRLRDEVRADRLDADQQLAVTRRLREWWEAEGDTARVQQLVDELRHRPDLFASTAPAVEGLARDLSAATDGDRERGLRRRLEGTRWRQLPVAHRSGIGVGLAGVVALLLGQATSDLYTYCWGCSPTAWGEEAYATGRARWPYLVLGLLLVAGLAAAAGVVRGIAPRVGAIVVLASGVVMLGVLWRDIAALTAFDAAVDRFGAGLLWTFLAAVLAVSSGAVLTASVGARPPRRAVAHG